VSKEGSGWYLSRNELVSNRYWNTLNSILISIPLVCKGILRKVTCMVFDLDNGYVKLTL
jgi:hypothetical protein